MGLQCSMFILYIVYYYYDKILPFICLDKIGVWEHVSFFVFFFCIIIHVSSVSFHQIKISSFIFRAEVTSAKQQRRSAREKSSR